MRCHFYRFDEYTAEWLYIGSLTGIVFSAMPIGDDTIRAMHRVNE